MDLYAYMQIGELEHFLTENNISIPRLRGLELCTDMTPWTEEEKTKAIEYRIDTAISNLLEADPYPWMVNPFCYSLDERSDRLKARYTYKKVTDTYIDSDGVEHNIYTLVPRWDRIHGRRRNALKLKLKQYVRKFTEYVKVWDKYCGREDVLRVHTRIGGPNWKYYGGEELAKQPWFLEKVDDYADRTYCDIYIKVK